MSNEKYDFGMIGLGTMGRNLVYNICDHGFSVAGFDKDIKQVETLAKEAGDKKLKGTKSLEEFVQSLKEPRTIIILVPAGGIVDSVISELKPLLANHDLILDCGNSHYTDTNRRIEALMKENISFMGVGVSGGESGARYGPSIMPGGDKEAYGRVSAMLEAVAAKVNNEPCVAWLGNGSSGHYVKMVHNGIEYALMQLIAETYQLLKQGAGMSNKEIHEAFASWNAGRLQSFLIEITSNIFTKKDELTDNDLIDMILDTAHQKGTGAWTSKDAMTLGIPIPSIDAAVTMRNLSSRKTERVNAQQQLKGPSSANVGSKTELLSAFEQALYFAMITTYAQGMALLHQASKEYNYNLNLIDIARIWKGGCIIRASLLEDIRSAFERQQDLPNLMVDEVISAQLNKAQSGLRKSIQTAVELGIPVPTLMTSLSYYDGYRSGWLPANLLQAQRDYFGAHTYERNDGKGVFHTHWEQEKNG